MWKRLAFAVNSHVRTDALHGVIDLRGLPSPSPREHFPCLTIHCVVLCCGFGTAGTGAADEGSPDVDEARSAVFGEPGSAGCPISWSGPVGPRERRGMSIGPVQLIVLGFPEPNFHGEIIAELERLRETDTVRVIDALAVHKDADGEV